jgi:hypothetical protein
MAIMRQFKPGQLQTGSIYPITSSYAMTASYAMNASVNTGSLVTTASFNAFTASYTTGSFTGSFQGDGSGLTNLPIPTIDTGSLVTTASFNSYTASQASVSASFDTRINTLTSSINTLTSSYNSFTSSYTTGSFTGSFTGTLTGTASRAITASYAIAGGSQYLQQVTDIGNKTTNAIYSLDRFVALDDFVAPDYITAIIPGGIKIIRSSSGEGVTVSSNFIGFGTETASAGFQITNVTATDVILEFPNKATGNYTISTTDDLTSYTTTSSFNSFTSSYNTGSFTGSFTGSLLGTAATASYITASNVVGTVTSASYAISASHLIGGTGSFVTTASFNAFTASYTTGSFTGSFTGPLIGTSSWANNALTASFVTASNVVGTVTSSSYAISASYLIGGITIDTGSLVTTSSFNTFTSSIQGQVNSLTAATSSYTLNSVTASMLAPYVLTSQTASMTVLSASYASTASYVTASNVYGPYGSNSIISSSYAVTASYAMNGGVTQLLAGPNVTLSPTNGLGQVTISSTGGGGSSFNTATGSYGSFYSTQTQTNVAGTARSMSLNTTDITNGVSISGSTNPFNTYIKVENAGVYDIQFSAQIDKSDAGKDEIWIWLRKNGTDLTDTATSIQLTGNADHQVAAWNFFANAAANDYFQLMWYSPDANVRLHAESAFGVVPGIPSLIVTANRIDQFLSNTGSFSGSFTGGFTGGFTGSLLGTATTASYVLNAVSSSFASTSSFVTASNVIGVVTSASYALTASYLIGGATIDTGSLVTTASFNSFTSSYTTGSFTGSFYGDGSNLLLSTSTTGVVVSFSASYIYNSSGSAGTGPITDNLTNAKLGIVQKIYHNSGSAPTVPAGWVKLGTGVYTTSTLNIIFAEWVSGSRVEYWIVKGS